MIASLTTQNIPDLIQSAINLLKISLKNLPVALQFKKNLRTVFLKFYCGSLKAVDIHRVVGERVLSTTVSHWAILSSHSFEILGHFLEFCTAKTNKQLSID